MLNKRKESQTLSATNCSECSVTATEGKLRPSPSHCSLPWSCSLPTNTSPLLPLPCANKLPHGLAELCGSSSPPQPPSSNSIWCINFGSDFLFTFLYSLFIIFFLWGISPSFLLLLLCIYFPFISIFNRVLLYSSDRSDLVMLWPQPHKCWDYKHTPPYLASVLL